MHMIRAVPQLPKNPRYSVGDVIDSLTVIEYMGWKTKPNSSDCRNFHLYRTECKCGNERIVYQEYLNSAKNKMKQCTECVEKSRKARLSSHGGLKRKVRVHTDQELMKQWKPPKSIPSSSSTEE